MLMKGARPTTIQYKPATWSDMLDHVLASGAEPGLGGHLEGSPFWVFTAVWRVTNSCYSLGVGSCKVASFAKESVEQILDLPQGLASSSGYPAKLQTASRATGKAAARRSGFL